jgi:hypothetical protein
MKKVEADFAKDMDAKMQEHEEKMKKCGEQEAEVCSWILQNIR